MNTNTEKRRKFIIDFMFFGIWVLIAFVVLKYGVSALAPFALALVISWMVKRPIEWLMRNLNMPRRWAAMLMVLIFYSTIGMVISLASIKALTEIVALVSKIPGLYESVVYPAMNEAIARIQELLVDLDPTLTAALEKMLLQLVSSMGDIVSKLSMGIVTMASGITSSLPGLFINIVLMIISTFFITIDYDKLTGFFYRQLEGPHKSTFMEIKEYIFGTLLVCIRSYALIMSITFVELSVGLSILRLENAVVIAFLISLFDILPVLGTGGIMLPWVAISVLLGDYGLALGLLIVYVVITVIRNIIEPKIVGKQIGLHPILTLSSMFLGVQLFGVLGLFGFPIGLSLLGNLNDKGIVHVFKSMDEPVETKTPEKKTVKTKKK